MKGKKLVVALTVFALVCTGVGLGIHYLHKDAFAGNTHTIKIKCMDCLMDLDGGVKARIFDGVETQVHTGDTGADGLIEFQQLHAGDDHWHAIINDLPANHNLGAGAADNEVFYEDHGFTFWVFCD